MRVEIRSGSPSEGNISSDARRLDVSSCAWSPDGCHLAVVFTSGEVSIVNLPRSVLSNDDVKGCELHFDQEAHIANFVHRIPGIAQPNDNLRVAWTASGLDLVVLGNAISSETYTILSF